MLEEYFSAPKTLRRLRTGPSAPYIDGFAAMLQENGYSVASAVRYLRAAVHLGHFLDSRGMSFAAIDARISETFQRHLPHCCCPLSRLLAARLAAGVNVCLGTDSIVNLGSDPLTPRGAETISTLDEARVLDRTIDVHVGRLREKLGDDAEQPLYVMTVRGVGYRPAPQQEA